MKLQRTKLGFTLIELLVVITIIGILATGATSVYTSQIQKARDSTRITDIKAVQSGVEQEYQDAWEYPDATTFSNVEAYVPKMPQDPKSGNASANSVFDYLYNVSDDSNSIPAQEYEVSTHFEQSGSISWKAATDWWNDPVRLEIWINVTDTDHNTVVSLAAWLAATVVLYDCVNATWTEWACAAASPMVIKNP